MNLLPRQSLSTQREYREQRARRPTAPILHLIVTLADGSVEYRAGSGGNPVRRAYLQHAGSDNHIIHLALVCQPLNLLGA